MIRSMQSKTTLANIVRNILIEVSTAVIMNRIVPRRPDDVSYIHDFQFGARTQRNGDFEEIEKGFNYALVT